MNERPTEEPQRPRVEPEIIPPGRAYRRAPGGEPGFAGFGAQRHFAIAMPGPLAFVMAGLALGAAAVAVLVLVLGAVLISLPVIGAIVAALLLSHLIRTHVRRLR
jgi:hypothetical protein